jgi:hypothetical protein
MKKNTLITAILILSVASLMSIKLYAQEKNENKSQSNKNKQKNIKLKQKTKKGAPTFVPSEKIGADSSVSFPVDI